MEPKVVRSAEEQKLEDFGGDVWLASEYSGVKTCKKNDLGYHCSCYDYDKGCCICEES